LINPSKPHQPSEAYCDSCGENVRIATILQDKGGQITTCTQCGFPIQQKQDIPENPKLENVIIVEDTELVRQILSEIMLKTGFAQKIISCQNGEEFLATVTEMLAGQKPVGMVFLDVLMPVLDGVNAALALRAIEKGLKTSKPIPILFFTVKKCDEEFRKLLHRVSPALYVNKISDASPQQLVQRLQNIVARLSTPGQIPSFLQAKK
jgi:CheY-like chemotaxis protein